MREIRMGDEYVDVVTGYRGIVTEHAEYAAMLMVAVAVALRLRTDEVSPAATGCTLESALDGLADFPGWWALRADNFEIDQDGVLFRWPRDGADLYADSDVVDAAACDLLGRASKMEAED